MAQRVGIVFHVAVLAAGAGIGRVALLGAGRRGHDGLVVVAHRLHGTGLERVATGAGPGLFTSLGAARRGGLGPGAEVVAQGGQLDVACVIAAGASLIGVPADLGTARFLRVVLDQVVAQRLDRLRLHSGAAGAASGFLTVGRAAGLGGHAPFAPAMAQGVRLARVGRVTAGTGTSLHTARGAGRRRRLDPFAPIVAKGRDCLRAGLDAGPEANVGLGTRLGAGRLLDHLLGSRPDVAHLGSDQDAALKLDLIDHKTVSAERLRRFHGIRGKGERRGVVAGSRLAEVPAAVAEHHGVHVFGIQNDLVVVVRVHFLAFRLQGAAGIGQILGRRGNRPALARAVAEGKRRLRIRFIHKIDVDVLGRLLRQNGLLLVDGNVLLCGQVRGKTGVAGIILDRTGLRVV